MQRIVPGSIEAAIKRGYWMLEVDIRRTSDGEPILQHDPTFRRFYGDERRVEDLTWARGATPPVEAGRYKPHSLRGSLPDVQRKNSSDAGY